VFHLRINQGLLDCTNCHRTLRPETYHWRAYTVGGMFTMFCFFLAQLLLLLFPPFLCFLAVPPVHPRSNLLS